MLNPVKPCVPVAPWMGGKSRLADFLVRTINAIPHAAYAEAFVGMGGVFFRRDFRPKTEVINDYSRDVANLFRILNVHYVPFMEMLKYQLTTRVDFERLLGTDPDQLTDMQRAARFLYLQKTAFGGKVTGQNFGVLPQGTARFDITKLASILEDVHTRLSSVVIECLDYKTFIRRYDTPETLFYLDPPYYGCEDDYGDELFSRDEFPLMAELLRGIKGKFLLSLNDTPQVREIFAGFHFLDVRTNYTVAGGEKQKKVGEVVIANCEGYSLL